ncbi:MAG: rod shape-determining protein [Synergistota bacterium]|nr:rod shape-determining protein [Synergistota bacterium]
MLGSISGFFGKDIAIDLGTANIVVYVKGKGVVVNEPSIIAYRKPNRRSPREIIAFGGEAKAMAGKTPRGVETVRPLLNGVIADFDMTGALIRHFLEKASNGMRVMSHPRVVVCAPVQVTEVERKAFIDATLDGGAREAYVVEEPVAAAIGVGLPIAEPRGNMILDIGGGTSEVGVVVSRSLRAAGDEMDAAIMSMLRQKYTMSIGPATAEEIKNTVGTAVRRDDEKHIEVRGRNLTDGLPRSMRISSGEALEALNPVVGQIVEMVRETLENTPPELARDIADQGIVLTGGVALLGGLDERLSSELNAPVMRAERPLFSVAEGLGKLLEQIDSMKKVLVSVGHGVR